MNNRKKAAFAAAALALLSGPAVAEQFYLGANVTQMNLDAGTDAEAEPVNLSVNAGYVIGQGVSAELRLGNTVSSDELTDSDIEVEFNEAAGLFLRAAVPDTTTITPYALVGYSSISLETSDPDGDTEERDHDIAYGFGVEYKAANNLSVGVEWMDYYRKDDIKLIGYALTARMGF